MREFRSFIALGDSFTEGVGDPGDDGERPRGWADRFAERLAQHNSGIRYANLAIRGKLLGEVIDEQIPAATVMRPDLISIAAGGNDLLRPRTDPDTLAAQFESAIAALTGAGSTVMAFTGFDPVAFPVIRMIRGRAAVFNMHIRAIASKYGCLLVDLWPMRVLTDRRLWAPDRLHLTPDGHHRVALMACEVAGVPVAADWRSPLPPRPVRPGFSAAVTDWVTARRDDLDWFTEHAGPYLSRRIHGVSSGDGMGPKRPALMPVLAGSAVPAALGGSPAPAAPSGVDGSFMFDIKEQRPTGSGGGPAAVGPADARG